MNNIVETLSEGAEPKRRSPLADFFIRLVREKPLGTVGGVIPRGTGGPIRALTLL